MNRLASENTESDELGRPGKVNDAAGNIRRTPYDTNRGLSMVHVPKGSM